MSDEIAWRSARVNWVTQAMGMLSLAWIKETGGRMIPLEDGMAIHQYLDFCMGLHEWERWAMEACEFDKNTASFGLWATEQNVIGVVDGDYNTRDDMMSGILMALPVTLIPTEIISLLTNMMRDAGGSSIVDEWGLSTWPGPLLSEGCYIPAALFGVAGER